MIPPFSSSSTWASNLLLRNNITVFSLFCAVFVALLFETPWFGPIIALDSVTLVMACMYLSALVFSWFALQKNWVSVRQIRSMACLGAPVFQNILVNHQLNTIPANSVAERFATVMLLQNPIISVLMAWFAGPSVGFSFSGVGIVVLSITYQSIYQWSLCQNLIELSQK